MFTTESPERRERYDVISAYMKGHKLRCLVDFEYRDHSIRSAGDGKWYPLILMDWVQGETLFDWVRARCLEGDGEALAPSPTAGWTRSRNWPTLGRPRRLQHANVMVNARGRVKLVDYDGMCVPALVGRRNLEVGVEPYQHPQRDARRCCRWTWTISRPWSFTWPCGRWRSSRSLWIEICRAARLRQAAVSPRGFPVASSHRRSITT